MDRRVFIIGNAMLFSTLGCDDGGTETLDMGGEVRDARAGDMGEVPDVGEPTPDMAPPEEDMAPPEEDMAPPGVDMDPTEPDAEPPEEDMAPPEPDAEPPEEDMAPPEPDAEPPEEDMAPPEPDAEPPEPDMEIPDPEPEPPAMCVDTLGEACVIENAGCCPNGQDPETVCWRDGNGELVWQAIPGDFFCNCFLPEGDTTYQVICAVPGFVGITVAGRRLRGPRLRALLAAV